MLRWAAPCIFLVLQQIEAGAQHFVPAEAFPFPRAAQLANVDDGRRREILAALASPDRDIILAQLGVHSEIVGDEKWFDLSGLHIGRNELQNNANLKFICWDYAHIGEVDLSGVDWDQALLRNVTFDRVNLHGAHFDGSELNTADFVRCEARGATFRGAKLGTGTRFRECNLDNTRFDQCTAQSAWFYDGSMRNANFDGSILRNVKFTSLDATGATFRGADIPGADFFGSLLDDIDLTGAKADKLSLRKARLKGTLRLVDTHISKIFFGDLDVARVDVAYARWSDFRVGEEDDGDDKKVAGRRNDAMAAYVQAERIYRILSEKFRQSGYVSEHLGLRFRAYEARRKILALDHSQGWPLERSWLLLSKHLDGYGTQSWTLTRNAAAVILLFSCIYTAGLYSRQQTWFRWYQAQPEGAGYLKSENADYVEDKTRTSGLRSQGNVWQRGRTFIKMFGIGLGLSVEASFMFGEKLINIPNILELFHKRDDRAVPFGTARRLFALQASVGLVFFLLAGRMLILIVAG